LCCWHARTVGMLTGQVKSPQRAACRYHSWCSPP
jgi:hypothetical protein